MRQYGEISLSAPLYARTPLYARMSDVIATEVAGQTVLLNTKDWSYHEFGKVGSSLWELMEIPRSLPTLVDDLMAIYDIDHARCTQETRAFLDDMIAQGIVVLR